MNAENSDLHYASWWRRFVACLVDYGIIFVIQGYLQVWFGRSTPRALAILVIPFNVCVLAYFIYGHRRWGKTLGKHLVKTRVTSLDGSPLTWRQAVLRSIIDIAFTVVGVSVLVPVYLNMPTEGYAAMTREQRHDLLTTSWPAWYEYMSVAQQVWIYSEFVVILFNKRRRAIHDFIAGTVVIHLVRKKTTIDDPPRACPSCGEKYRLGDYMADAEHIFCSKCKKELHRQ